MFRQCVICGNDFDTKGTRKKVCSPECKKAHKKQVDKDYHKAHPEAQRQHFKKYCSKNTEYFHQRYLRNRALILIRGKLKKENHHPFCSVCGKEFKPKYKGEKICSDQCRENSPLYQLWLGRPEAFAKYFSCLLGE